uniref:Signal recognition particle receptor subunit beta n=1 Tax=Erpetoichthys calabaricus TaxID=27687 RepID=A0A8C4RXM0_ERPCA
TYNLLIVIAKAFLTGNYKRFNMNGISRSPLLSNVICGRCTTLPFLSPVQILHVRIVRLHTQTSITDSSASYRVTGDKNSTLTLIDIPGHESLRLQFLEKFKSAARAIIFVVDSAIFQKEVRDVAELLYIVLTDDIIEKNGIALAVACNKQDVVMSKSSKLIQQQLEKELNTLRVTRSAALSSLDDSTGTGSMYLGKKGKDFEFSQLPFKVDFIECSARGSKEDSEPDIRELEKWLHSIV